MAPVVVGVKWPSGGQQSTAVNRAGVPTATTPITRVGNQPNTMRGRGRHRPGQTIEYDQPSRQPQLSGTDRTEREHIAGQLRVVQSNVTATASAHSVDWAMARNGRPRPPGVVSQSATDTTLLMCSKGSEQELRQRATPCRVDHRTGQFSVSVDHQSGHGTATRRSSTHGQRGPARSAGRPGFGGAMPLLDERAPPVSRIQSVVQAGRQTRCPHPSPVETGRVLQRPPGRVAFVHCRATL